MVNCIRSSFDSIKIFGHFDVEYFSIPIASPTSRLEEKERRNPSRIRRIENEEMVIDVTPSSTVSYDVDNCLPQRLLRNQRN